MSVLCVSSTLKGGNIVITMPENGLEEFPHEFRELSPEESELISKYYKGPLDEFVRVGSKGYLLPKRYESQASSIYNMTLRPSDVFVNSFQRSGTTLTQELVWLVVKDLDYKTAKSTLLTQRYPFLELCTFFSEKVRNFSSENFGGGETQTLLKLISQPATEQLAVTLDDPRFVKTHLPLSLLPPKLLDTTKVLYVARDPRDVIVSCYHHTKLFQIYGFDDDFKGYWNMFIKDLFTLTPYFEHLKESWAKRDHPNMLFLFYEELLKDMPAAVNRVADFFGKQFSEEQINELCDHLSFKNFKNNVAVNYEDMRDTGFLASDESFVRKGKAGGWREYFDEDMTREAERWISSNLRDTDLRFPYMDHQ